jgi:ketopantoate hydroxymethyltransferase
VKIKLGVLTMKAKKIVIRLTKATIALSLSVLLIGMSSSQEADKQLAVSEDTFSSLTDME